MVKINFDAIEARLKELVESSAFLVAGHQSEIFFPAQLAAAVEAYLKKEVISDLEDFPKSLLLEVPPGALEEWQEFPVADILQKLLQDAGMRVEIIPQIEIAGNEDLLADEVHLRNGLQKVLQLDKTASMPAISPQEDIFLGDTIPVNAFVIINGLETVLLTQPVVNIGRRLENDLVIEDQRISREHAQIRAVKGQYVIFDLNSSGGTFVNSVRISQQPLYPGDVISLAGIPLVYGEDNPPPYSDTGRVETLYNPESPGEKP
jgi:hypothetical protein